MSDGSFSLTPGSESSPLSALMAASDHHSSVNTLSDGSVSVVGQSVPVNTTNNSSGNSSDGSAGGDGGVELSSSGRPVSYRITFRNSEDAANGESKLKLDDLANGTAGGSGGTESPVSASEPSHQREQSVAVVKVHSYIRNDPARNTSDPYLRQHKMSTQFFRNPDLGALTGDILPPSSSPLVDAQPSQTQDSTGLYTSGSGPSSSSSTLVPSDNVPVAAPASAGKPEKSLSVSEFLDLSPPADEEQTCFPESAFLHKFCTPAWFLFFLCLFVLLQSTIVTGLLAACLSTIEIRYSMTSTQLGFISSSYDITVLIAVSAVGYIGTRHIPRVLGIGLLLIGIGSIFFLLPEPVAGNYEFQGAPDELDLCGPPGPPQHTLEAPKCSGAANTVYALFIFAQIVIGCGASPLYTLGTTYIDVITPRQHNALYLAIFYALAAVGPALGFILGGAFLNLWVEPNNPPSNITPSNPNWVGAWWIPFLIVGLISIVAALPFFLYPKLLPGTTRMKHKEAKEIRQEHMAEREKQTTKKPSVVIRADNVAGPATIKDRIKRFFAQPEVVTPPPPPLQPHEFGIWPSCLYLLKNKSWIFNSLATGWEAFIVAGFSTFLPKVVSGMFGLSASSAAFAVGLVIIPGAAGGIFVGGLVMRRLNLNPTQTALMTWLLPIFALFLMFGFFIGCDTIYLAGVTRSYGPDRVSISTDINYANLSSLCNADCNCQRYPYSPVCGSDSLNYFNPCYAGCKSQSNDSESKQDFDSKTFTLCSCTAADPANPQPGEALTAHGGKCDNGCANFGPFMGTLFLIMFFTFMNNVPGTVTTLRVLRLEYRAFGMSVQSAIYRLIGTIPGPILFGVAIDSTCTFWEQVCGSQGNCWEYDNILLRHAFVGLAVGFKSASALCFFLSWVYFAPVTDPVPVSNSEEQVEAEKVDSGRVFD